MPKRTDIHSVLIIGAGPIIIGQACEFDYSGTQACKALARGGLPHRPGQFQSGHHHDRPGIRRPHLHRADHARMRRKNHRARNGGNEALIRARQGDKLVLLPTLGGQTALNTAMASASRGVLEKYGIEMIGANGRRHRARRRPRRFSRN